MTAVVATRAPSRACRHGHVDQWRERADGKAVCRACHTIYRRRNRARTRGIDLTPEQQRAAARAAAEARVVIRDDGVGCWAIEDWKIIFGTPPVAYGQIDHEGA